MSVGEVVVVVGYFCLTRAAAATQPRRLLFLSVFSFGRLTLLLVFPLVPSNADKSPPLPPPPLPAHR